MSTRASVTYCGRIGRYEPMMCWLGYRRPLPSTALLSIYARTMDPKFIAQAVQRWLQRSGIKIRYIDPDSPWQNGFAESFHGRFRDECLNREQFWTLTEARVVIEDYLSEYNQHRPHR
jgi:transposase InsO family protein